MLALLMGLAGPIATLAGKILDLQTAKEQAKTYKEKAEIDQQIQEAQERKAMYIQEARSKFVSGLYACFKVFGLGIPVAAIFWKLYFWDKVVGGFYGCTGQEARNVLECTTFRTDPLDMNQWLAIGAVLAFFLGYDIFAKSRRP